MPSPASGIIRFPRTFFYRVEHKALYSRRTLSLALPDDVWKKAEPQQSKIESKLWTMLYLKHPPTGSAKTGPTARKFTPRSAPGSASLPAHKTRPTHPEGTTPEETQKMQTESSTRPWLLTPMPVSGNLAKWQTRSIITVGSVDFPYTRKIRGLSLKLKKLKTFYFATIIDS